ncbi:MAG TPA: type I methionyl aminopeptidase [Oscillospiraceae bacterium]|nr:type I methionyl aminopeptidase [Oscillospiraceae bacterium]
MVIVKTATEVSMLREAGRISALALKTGGEAVGPGVTTGEIDKLIHDFIVFQGATPSFLNYEGFPATACISVNDEIIHGIPGSRVLIEGDVVTIDVGACVEGYHGDNAATFAVGKISPEARHLLDATRESLYQGIAQAAAGNRIGDISWAVQSYVEERGYSVIRNYTGHGVGRDIHEDPEVPNFGKPGHGLRLVGGMVIAIEPMVNAGGRFTHTDSNGWTVRTADGSNSAHFEHTIAITKDGPVILTLP